MTTGIRNERLVKHREMARRALEMRIAGHTYDAIAAAIGYSDKSHAHRAVQNLQKKRIAATVDEMRELENARLDALQAAIWDTATAADLAAIEQVRRLMERRAKMNGLDAPTKQEVTGADAGPVEFVVKLGKNAANDHAGT